MDAKELLNQLRSGSAQPTRGEMDAGELLAQIRAKPQGITEPTDTMEAMLYSEDAPVNQPAGEPPDTLPVTFSDTLPRQVGAADPSGTASFEQKPGFDWDQVDLRDPESGFTLRTNPKGYLLSPFVAQGGIGGRMGRAGKRVGGGAVSGATLGALRPYADEMDPTTGKRFGEQHGYMAGEMVGMMAPWMGAYAGAAKLTGPLAKSAVGMSRAKAVGQDLLGGIQRVVRGGSIGAGITGAEQLIGEYLHNEEHDVKDIGNVAAIAAGLDLLVHGAGSAWRQLHHAGRTKEAAALAKRVRQQAVGKREGLYPHEGPMKPNVLSHRTVAPDRSKVRSVGKGPWARDNSGNLLLDRKKVTLPEDYSGLQRPKPTEKIVSVLDRKVAAEKPVAKKQPWEMTDTKAITVRNEYVKTLPYGDRFVKDFDWQFKGTRQRSHSEVEYQYEYKPKGGKVVEEPIIEGSKITRKRVVYGDKRTPVEEVKTNPNHAYRGMSYDEWLAAEKRGYIKSEGLYNFDVEKGHTLFADNFGSAQAYAGGFAPSHLAGTFERPGVIVGIPKSLTAKAPGAPGSQTGYLSVKGRVPISEIGEVYHLLPRKSGIGEIGIVKDTYTGAIKEGSAAHSTSSYDVIKGKPKPVAKEVKPTELGATGITPQVVKETAGSVGKAIKATVSPFRKDLTRRIVATAPPKLTKQAPGPKTFASRTASDSHAKGKEVVNDAETMWNTISLKKKSPESIAAFAEKGGKLATKQTRTGKEVPSIRQSGVYVPKEFTQYKKFKDAKGGLGGSKDPLVISQEIDGALTAQQRAKLPEGAGPVEVNVKRRTEDIEMMKLDWTTHYQSVVQELFEGLGKKQRKHVSLLWDKISQGDAVVSPGSLLKRKDISAITKDGKAVRAAQETRKLLDDIIRQQNQVRKAMGRPEIPYRKLYGPNVLRELTVFERTFARNKTAKEIMALKDKHGQPIAPDFIIPNAPRNPHALAREAGIPNYMRELDAGQLLEGYLNTASKDMFHTMIIENNKAFANQLESMGYKFAARNINDWTAQTYAGVKGPLDAPLFGPMGQYGVKLVKVMRGWRRALMRSIFPGNTKWSFTVQPLSAVNTVGRYGVRNSIAGVKDWFTNSEIRSAVKNTYAYRTKAAQYGTISRQDLGRETAGVKITKNRREKVSDALTYFNAVMERNLTGWSAATAGRHGAARGLEGKGLQWYMSDGGAKTQSMYDMANLPGILRNEVVKTGAPFQTYKFTLYNTLKEFAGKTGTPPHGMSERIGWMLRFTGGIAAANYISETAIGRSPFSPYSFIPFSNMFIKPWVDGFIGDTFSLTSGRGLPAPISAAISLGQASKTYMKTGDTRKLRNWGIKYVPSLFGIPAGTTASRMIDGMIAVANEGMYDSRGREMFEIVESDDKTLAILGGPWSTSGGREYIRKQNKPWWKMFSEAEKSSKPKTYKKSKRGSSR